jgi:hypothetical protein
VIDDPAAQRLARVYVWWQPAETTLADPRKLLCQILRLGRAEDYLEAERLWGVEALRARVAAEKRDGKRFRLRLLTKKGKLTPGTAVADRDALYARMEGRG